MHALLTDLLLTGLQASDTLHALIHALTHLLTHPRTHPFILSSQQSVCMSVHPLISQYFKGVLGPSRLEVSTRIADVNLI